jgi:hypothetical protein
MSAVRVTRELPVVVTNNADDKPRCELPPNRPLEVKFVAGLVVRLRILEVGRDAAEPMN